MKRRKKRTSKKRQRKMKKDESTEKWQRFIGVRITKRREELNMTTIVLADKIGLSQAQISRLENGKQGVRSAVLLKLAESLGVPPCYFVMSDKEYAAFDPSGRKKKKKR